MREEGKRLLRAIDGTKRRKEHTRRVPVYSYKISVQIVKSVHNDKARGVASCEESIFCRARTAAISATRVVSLG